MFYDKFADLCKKKGVRLGQAASEMGLSGAAVSRWKRYGYSPRSESMQRIADYFGVSISSLMEDEKKEPQALSEKEKRDIAREVDKIMGDLGDSGDLMFDGVPMNDEARTAMAAAMHTALEVARTLNKKTYTPKKYRKEEGQ